MPRLALFSLAAFFLFAQQAFGAEDPRTILEKAQNEGTPKSMQSNMTMTLTDAGGRSKSRVLKMEGVGNDKSLVWFVQPADLKGTAFLRLGDAKNRKMWLYLPAFKKLERISGSKENESFLGSDFTYADMSDRDLDKFGHKYLGKEKLGGRSVHKIESALKEENDEEPYGKIVSYVDAATGQLLREDLYDSFGDLVKQKTNEGFKKVGGYLIPINIVMKDLGTKHQTRIEMKSIEVDKPISDNRFSTEAMKRIRP